LRELLAVARDGEFRHGRAGSRFRGGHNTTMRNDGAVENEAGAAAAPLKLEEFLPYRLNVLASLASQALSRIYAERYGIGVPEWRVLVTLGQHGVMTGKAIGLHSHMHKTKVSRAVAELERRKLLARRANRDDKRESFLSLTPNGRAMYEDLAPIALDFARRLVEVLNPADRAAFDRALRQLTDRSARLASELANGRAQAEEDR
jgi:DNA-binding MarR family transcriptional regulator